MAIFLRWRRLFELILVCLILSISFKIIRYGSKYTKLASSSASISYKEFIINSSLITNPHLYTYTLNPGSTVCSDKILLVIFVSTHPNDFEKRLIIRNSWGNQTRFKMIRILFPLGLAENNLTNELIKLESQDNNDIVQEDFLDIEQNSAVKLTMSFKWITQYCSQTKYVAWFSQDLVLNTFSTIKFLQDQESKKRTTGIWMGEIKNLVLKPFENNILFKRDASINITLNYCQDSAYILTTDLVYKFYYQILTIKLPPSVKWTYNDYIPYIARQVNIKYNPINKYFLSLNQTKIDDNNLLLTVNSSEICSSLLIFAVRHHYTLWRLIELNFKDPETLAF